MIVNCDTPKSTEPKFLWLGPIGLGISFSRPTLMPAPVHGLWAQIDLFGLGFMLDTNSFHVWVGPRLFGFGFRLHLDILRP